ncbi:LOW QUALITY PROTEIN: hypothetical protein TorRG33x02_060450 [Trema orientale]|uniref:Uncharacterized protein n=1 Tax=Trema orientale TaxID=63057 RepID=A0A2P5FK93_TREOI|nr:LOW QUALITY PROTEIN: hypothetical protein TorRG33x02_060450 [Trema orientale]
MFGSVFFFPGKNFLILLAALNELVVKIVPGKPLAGISAGKLAGLGEESNDNNVSEEENEPRARQDAGEVPEKPAGVLDGDRDVKRKPGNQDEDDENLDEPEQVCDLSELIVPQYGVGLLSFDVVEVEGVHF